MKGCVRTAWYLFVAQPWPGMILGFFAVHASASSLPGRTPLRVAVCLVGEPRSAAQTAPSIRRHVLDVLDAEAFMVSHISNGHRGLNESLAIERLLGPRVRRAVHRTAQELQPAGLATRLEQVAEPLLRRATKLAAHSTLSTPLTSSPPSPCHPQGAAAQHVRCYVEHEALMTRQELPQRGWRD